MNSDDVYDIHRYTDEQLMNILNLTNPTDHELEAKILQMIRRYSNIQNESGTKLAHFFNRVYEHFFDTSDDLQDENMENIETMEGFISSAATDKITEFNYNTKDHIAIDLSGASLSNIIDKKNTMKDGKINYQSYSKVN